MAKRVVDPLRLQDGDERLELAQQAGAYLVKQRGVRGAAKLLGWTMADMSRISNAQWKQIRMYPSTVETLLMAQTLVENDEKLIAPLRDEFREFAREAGATARREARIRGMIKKVTR